jgi:hypothetical protein
MPTSLYIFKAQNSKHLFKHSIICYSRKLVSGSIPISPLLAAQGWELPDLRDWVLWTTSNFLKCKVSIREQPCLGQVIPWWYELGSNPKYVSYSQTKHYGIRAHLPDPDARCIGQKQRRWILIMDTSRKKHRVSLPTGPAGWGGNGTNKVWSEKGTRHQEPLKIGQCYLCKKLKRW